MSSTLSGWIDVYLPTKYGWILTLDKKIIVWQLTRDENNYGYAKRALSGHNHFVQDVCISSDGQFALSASWGKSL